MAKIELTLDLLKELFEYKDGFLYRRVNSKKGPGKIGDRAGTINHTVGGDRYVITINCVPYLQSRLIFFYNHGYFPLIVDHKDHDTLNDKLENLRDASHHQNNRNRSSAKNSTSKYLGVSYVKERKNWLAVIRFRGVPKYLGRYKTEEEAALAYNEAAKISHGEFANLNIII